MNTATDICNALRNAGTLDHHDLISINACFAAMVNKQNAIGQEAKAVILDYLDTEIRGAIERDQIEYESEAAWTGREIPGFGDLRAQFDALTVRRVAA